MLAASKMPKVSFLEDVSGVPKKFKGNGAAILDSNLLCVAQVERYLLLFEMCLLLLNDARWGNPRFNKKIKMHFICNIVIAADIIPPNNSQGSLKSFAQPSD